MCSPILGDFWLFSKVDDVVRNPQWKILKKKQPKKNDLMKNFTCRRIVSSLSFLSLHICHNPPLSLFYTLSQPLFRCCTDNHTHTYIPAGHGRNNNPARQVEYIGRHHWLFSSSSSSSLLFLCVGNPFGTFE